MKYGRYEYERTFIVSGEILKENVKEVKNLTDIYFIDTKLRLRKMEKKGVVKYKLTQKTEVNPAKEGIKSINTLYLTKPEYEKLMNLAGYKIEKKRYIIIRQEKRIGVDEIELEGRKLYLAEIEYETEEEMKESLIPINYEMEVTSDRNYSGIALAKLFSKKNTP